MAGRHYYTVTALPALAEPGSVPPITAGELAEHVRDLPGPRDLVGAILLSDDLLQREAFLSGQLGEVSPAVLTARQAANEQPLPSFLAAEAGGQELTGRELTDAVWTRYYRYAAEVARRWASRFLDAWIGCEVALRNGLAEERASALGLDPTGYRVVPDLAQPAWNLDVAISEWAAAGDPLQGERALDRWRWGWLDENDPRFSFEDDELAVYGARLIVLVRWDRLTRPGTGLAERLADLRST